MKEKDHKKTTLKKKSGVKKVTGEATNGNSTNRKLLVGEPISEKQIVKRERQNDVICIIGMHRSGTSLVARLLNLCGLDLGPSENFLDPNDSNPLGFFENEDFTYKIDDGLLNHLGGTWDKLPYLKEGWEYDPSLEPFVQQAQKLIQSFSESPRWGWKDPRTTILLPFWKSLIPNLRFVICVRSPLEVAKSLALRDRIPIEKGVYLWNQYMQASILHTQHSPRIFVFYEDLFDKAASEITRTVQFCGLKKPQNLSSLCDVISNELRHHTSETLDLLEKDKHLTEHKLFYIGLRALTTKGFVPSTSDGNQEALVSTNISKFFKLMEQFHDEQLVAQLQSALVDKEEKLTKIGDTLHRQQQSQHHKDEQLAKLRAQQRILKHDLGNLHAVLNEKERLVANLTAEQERAAQEANTLRSTLQTHEQILNKKDEQLVNLTAEQERAAQEANTLRSTLQTHEQILNKKDEQLVNLTAEQAHTAQEANTLRSTVQTQQQGLNENEEQVTHLTAEKRRLTQEIETLQSTLQMQQQMFDEKEEQVAHVTSEQGRLMQETEALQSIVQTQHQTLSEKEERMVQLTSEKEQLAQEAETLQVAIRTQRQSFKEKEEQLTHRIAEQQRFVQQADVLNDTIDKQQKLLFEKERLMAKLLISQKLLTNEVKESRESVNQKSERMKFLLGQLKTLNAKVKDLRLAVEVKEKQLGQFELTIQDQHLALMHRQEKTTHLAAKIDDLSGQLKTLQVSLEEKSEQANNLFTKHETLNVEVKTLQTNLSQKEGELAHLQSTAQAQQQLLNTIHTSLSWKIVSPIWKLTDIILPLGSRRREMCRLVYNSPALLTPRHLSRAVKNVRLFGFFTTLKEVSKKLKSDTRYLFNSSVEMIPAVNNCQNLTEDASILTKDATVSVVIPVKNGGDDLRFLLSQLRTQKGLKQIDIIVVDSGSADGSLKICEQYGVEIIEILPDEFSHSYARNLGAEYANGDYILFTVQDALPASEFWLYELLTAVEDNGVVAVSCAEFPREDADLFYRAMSWNHNKFMEVDNQDRILCKPIHENHLTLRKNGQLSDIACMISREVFMKYKFKGDYAEDLDLGIRLIRDGHKLALLSSTRVIHSHNRPAYYHLRRGYIDDLFLTQILPDRPVPAIIIEGLFRDITYTTEIINQIVFKKLPGLVLPCAPNKLYNLVLKEFQSGAKGRYGSVSGDMHGNCYVDDKFRSFIENVNDRSQLNGQNSSCDGVLISSMESFTKVIFEYVDETYELIDEELLEDFKSCLFKQFAFQCGLHLCSSFTRGSDSIKKELEEINRELSQEI